MICPNCGEEVEEGVKFCAYCGSEIPDNTKNESSSSNNSSKKKNKKSSWWGRKTGFQKLLIILAIIFIIGGIFNLGSGSDQDSGNESIDDASSSEPKISEADFKNQSVDVSYDELSKNPSSFYAKKLVFSGTIVEIHEDYGATTMRVDMNGNFGDTVYITYDGSVPVYEGDTITIYGEGFGEKTYTSQANYEITIPWIHARYIDY